MAFDVVTFGSATYDVFLLSDEFRLENTSSGVMLCEGFGSKINIKNRVATTGGGASNAAVCFERLGLQSALVACVGMGHWSRIVRHKLEQEGVSLLYLQKSKTQQTSSSVLLVAPNGGRTALVHRAASNALSWKDVDWQRLAGKWAYVSSLGGDLTLLSKIVRWSQDKNVKLAVNPGSGELKSAKLKDYLKYFEVLILNREELELLLNKKIKAQLPEKDVLSLESKITIITDGKNGAWLFEKGKPPLHQPAKKVKAIEETGAGDAFGSGFVAGQMLGYSLQKSLLLAAHNSSSVVQKIGAKAGLLFLPEVKKLLL